MTTKVKKHFIKQIAAKTGYDKDLISKVIDTLHYEIILALEEPGTVVRLDCFGTFRDTQRISQILGKGANPWTGTKGPVYGWKKSHWVRFTKAALFEAHLNPHSISSAAKAVLKRGQR